VIWPAIACICVSVSGSVPGGSWYSPSAPTVRSSGRSIVSLPAVAPGAGASIPAATSSATASSLDCGALKPGNASSFASFAASSSRMMSSPSAAKLSAPAGVGAVGGAAVAAFGAPTGFAARGSVPLGFLSIFLPSDLR
jgi:hypothetical protein